MRVSSPRSWLHEFGDDSPVSLLFSVILSHPFGIDLKFEESDQMEHEAYGRAGGRAFMFAQKILPRFPSTPVRERKRNPITELTAPLRTTTMRFTLKKDQENSRRRSHTAKKRFHQDTGYKV